MNGRLALLVALGLVIRAGAAVPGAAPPYRADRTDPRIIRIWGDPGLADLARIWEDGYRRSHPEIGFENRFVSTAMAMPGIYLGLADIAFLGREANVTDRDGFAHVRAYPPQRFEIATGSLATPGKSPALVVFVHRDNPLGRLTLQQLAGAFGCRPASGAPQVRTWGDLGLGGSWAARPINLYLFDIESGTGQYFLQAVLGGSHQLAWERLQEFPERARPDGTRETAEEQILTALRSDPYGLAVAGGRSPSLTARRAARSTPRSLPSSATFTVTAEKTASARKGRFSPSVHPCAGRKPAS